MSTSPSVSVNPTSVSVNPTPYVTSRDDIHTLLVSTFLKALIC